MEFTVKHVERALFEDGLPPRTVELFLNSWRKNKLVWEAFERFTLSAISKQKKLGAKAIMERVRWEAEIERGQEFKVNNNFTAYYARAFTMKYPEHGDYFELRHVSGLSKAA